jgi:hypothetical protein
MPYAGYAEPLGLRGMRVTSAEQMAAAWDAALSADRPAVIDAVLDPAMSLLPPGRPAEQTKAMYAGLAAEKSYSAAGPRRICAGSGPTKATTIPWSDGTARIGPAHPPESSRG